MQSVGFVFLLFLLAPITQYNVFMPPIGLRLLSRRPSHLNLQFDYSALFHWFRAYFVWVSGDGGGIRREHEVWCAFVLCFARLLVGRSNLDLANGRELSADRYNFAPLTIVHLTTLSIAIDKAPRMHMDQTLSICYHEAKNIFRYMVIYGITASRLFYNY